MTAEETLALDAGMRRKMEQAGATPGEVKRQLQFKRKQGRPISRDGRCMYEDLGNTLRMLGVAVTKRELLSFSKRFRGTTCYLLAACCLLRVNVALTYCFDCNALFAGTRDDEVEANMILENLWSEPVMRASNQISIQPSVWVGSIPDCAARGDLLRALFKRFGTVTSLSLSSKPFDQVRFYAKNAGFYAETAVFSAENDIFCTRNAVFYTMY